MSSSGEAGVPPKDLPRKGAAVVFAAVLGRRYRMVVDPRDHNGDIHEMATIIGFAPPKLIFMLHRPSSGSVIVQRSMES